MECFSWYPTLQDLNPKCWSWLLRWCFQWITRKIPPSHPPVRHWRIRPHLLKHWRLGGPKRLSRGILHRRLFHPFPLSVAPRSSRDFKATILRRTAIIRGLQRPNMPFFKSWHLSQLEAVISFFEETWWYLHFYISGTSWSNRLQDDFCTLLTSLPSLYSIRNQDPKTIRPWRKLRCLTKKNLQKYVPLKSCSRRPAAKRTRREPGHFFLLGTDLKQSDHRRGGKQLLTVHNSDSSLRELTSNRLLWKAENVDALETFVSADQTLLAWIRIWCRVVHGHTRQMQRSKNLREWQQQFQCLRSCCKKCHGLAKASAWASYRDFSRSS